MSEKEITEKIDDVSEEVQGLRKEISEPSTIKLTWYGVLGTIVVLTLWHNRYSLTKMIVKKAVREVAPRILKKK
jgi:hypothetical protein